MPPDKTDTAIAVATIACSAKLSDNCLKLPMPL